LKGTMIPEGERENEEEGERVVRDGQKSRLWGI